MSLHNIYSRICNLAKNEHQIRLESIASKFGEEVKEKCPYIELGFVVGSVARGDPHKDSDIDAKVIRKYCPWGADEYGVNGSKSPDHCGLVKILDNYPDVDCQLSVCNWVCQTKEKFVNSYNISTTDPFSNIIKKNYLDFMLHSKPIFERSGSMRLKDLKRMLKEKYENIK